MPVQPIAVALMPYDALWRLARVELLHARQLVDANSSGEALTTALSNVDQALKEIQLRGEQLQLSIRESGKEL